MSLKNKKMVQRFIREFISGNDYLYQNYLDDDVKWNIVGMPPINGKRNFLEAMEMMEIWQSPMDSSNKGNENNVIAEGDFVVIQNSINTDNPGNGYIPAHCDIYRINRGKITEVTTYLVDTSVNEL